MALLFAAAVFVFVILNAFAIILAFCRPSMYRGCGDKVLGLSVMAVAVIAIETAWTLHRRRREISGIVTLTPNSEFGLRPRITS
jgi:hypothetical protein